VSSASTLQLRFGFKVFTASPQQFCPDVVEGCPIDPGKSFIIKKVFNFSKSLTHLYPLADITAQYSAVDAESNHLTCVKVAAIGYQDPTWQRIFTYIPISLTLVAALLSLITTMFSLFQRDEQQDDDTSVEYENSFFAAFNYTTIISPELLRLKTPGFFDLIFYAQFIIIVGLFNLDYPRFYALLTSNFSWSFLIWETSWVKGLTQYLFPVLMAPIDNVASIPHYTLYKRQQ
ncbi:hypothetical protein BDF20DRAFT_800363, partial [Mycotypha africana]|uniref:uncharacterized protein n=1 Tax=Mycotypha africana TaxID=64632 RepID=UPI0023009424